VWGLHLHLSASASASASTPCIYLAIRYLHLDLSKSNFPLPLPEWRVGKSKRARSPNNPAGPGVGVLMFCLFPNVIRVTCA
jgi:hypothetical protein